MIERARDLRKNLTDAERKLWPRRQHPIGPYIVDFVCLELRLVIEVDGRQDLDGADVKRGTWLASQGYQVLRFWDNQVLNETVAVSEAVAQVVCAEEEPSS